MNLIIKSLCLLLLSFSVIRIFPQGQFYVSNYEDIVNSDRKSIINNLSFIKPFINESSSTVLDSIICNYLDGNKTKLAYNYNNDLSLNYFTFANWFNGEWIISDKRTNTYSFEGYLESVLWEWFNPITQDWFDDAKDVYNYDSLGNRIYYLHQNFDGQEFVNAFKNEMIYDSLNNLVSADNQIWIDSIWVNQSKLAYTYNPENLNDTILFQNWLNEQWINYQLNIYKYDSNRNITSILAKRWQADNWVNFAVGTLEYDFNNNCVLENYEIANNNTLENWFRIFYEYDENNNLIHLFGEEWINGQWVPENEPLVITNPDGNSIGFIANEIFLYHSSPSNVESEENIINGFNLFQNYPNPFNPVTTITWQAPESGWQTIKIYNSLGEEIETLVDEYKPAGMHKVQFTNNNLPSGVYFYQLRAGEFVQTKKMILMK